MKRSLALALLVSLLAAPAVMAQPPTKPTAPARTKAVDPKATPASAQPAKKDEKAKDPNAGMEEQMKAWEEAAKPGPNHKLLERFEGEWQAEVKDLTPGGESTDKGTMTSKMVYGGRFLSMDYDGRFHGKFFRGGGILGYNNVAKRFESTWADSMGTALSFMSGSMSHDGKVLMLTGEMSDPTAAGGKSMAKETWTITGKDSYKQEFFMGGQKAMEITYTKGKAAEKKDDKKDEKPKGK